MATTINYVDVKGVKVPFIFEENRNLPLVSMQVVFQNSGSINDDGKFGLVKMSAKMMNEGSAKRGSEAFSEALESRAISLSAHSGSETFVFELESLKEELAEAKNLFIELLKAPNLDEKVLQRVQTTTLGQLSRKENDYDYVAGNLLKEIMYEGTPLAHSANGTLESIKEIKLADIKTFLASHLVVSRAIVVCGGDLSLEEAKADVKEILENLEVGKSEALVHYDVRKTPQEKTLKRETEQAYLYFGSPYNMSVGDSEYYKARVATFILGTGGFGSRLMEEIRVKRGLAYSAYARVSVTKSHSHLTGYLQTKLDSLDEAKKSVEEVYAKFLKDGVSEEELEQSKKFLLGSEPLRVETLSQRLGRTFQEYYKYGKVGASQEELDAIKNLKLSDLNAFITKHQEIKDMSFAIVTK